MSTHFQTWTEPWQFSDFLYFTFSSLWTGSLYRNSAAAMSYLYITLLFLQTRSFYRCCHFGHDDCWKVMKHTVIKLCVYKENIYNILIYKILELYVQPVVLFTVSEWRSLWSRPVVPTSLVVTQQMWGVAKMILEKRKMTYFCSRNFPYQTFPSYLG